MVRRLSLRWSDGFGAGQVGRRGLNCMDELDTPSILAVGARLANLARAKATGEAGRAEAAVTEVDSGREAMRLLRVLPFDLVAVGTELADMSAGQFASCLRQHRPWQKWLMVADQELALEEEVAARSLGAIAVLEGPDAWKHVVEASRRLRRRHPERTVPGYSLGTASV
jgi:DNA-binding response OmpR family regulator